MISHFSHIWLFATPWTIAYQAPLSMEFSREEYWSGLPFPSPLQSRGSSRSRDWTHVPWVFCIGKQVVLLLSHLGSHSSSFRDRQWHPTPVLLPGKSHGWRSLVGCNPWGRWESDTTERLHFHVSLSCIGEGNGNPLQCSCLENPRDEGAWWAAVYGIAQSRTRLKRLSSSSSSSRHIYKYMSLFLPVMFLYCTCY